MMFRAVFWVILPCEMIVDNHFTRQYNPEDSSEHKNNMFRPEKTRIKLYSTLALPIFLHCSENWTLRARGEIYENNSRIHLDRS
jgi:hypothetical protein